MGARVGHGPNGSTPTQDQKTKQPSLDAVPEKKRRRMLRPHDEATVEVTLMFRLDLSGFAPPNGPVPGEPK
jgi:hypothetical protein